MIWEIDGKGLEPMKVEAGSFDEAIAKCREIDPGYAGGKVGIKPVYGLKIQWFDNCKEVEPFEFWSDRVPGNTQQGGYATSYFMSKEARDAKTNELVKRGAMVVAK